MEMPKTQCFLYMAPVNIGTAKTNSKMHQECDASIVK